MTVKAVNGWEVGEVVTAGGKHYLVTHLAFGEPIGVRLDYKRKIPAKRANYNLRYCDRVPADEVSDKLLVEIMKWRLL